MRHARRRSWSIAELSQPMIPDPSSKWVDYIREAPRIAWTTIIKHQGKTITLLLIAFLSLALLYYVRTLLRQPEQDFASLAPGLAAAIAKSTGPSANLHFLIPASNGNANLCKLLVSAAIHGYPSPVLINWNEVFDQDLVDGGSHLAKISGVQDYLARLDHTKDEDLVLMVDGYDVWLQLRPQTLIDRYFAINQRADRRTNLRLGSAASQHDIHQEIVFGCQKKCWPWEAHDTPCYAVPESDLPEHIYGPDTDKMSEKPIEEEPNPWRTIRPRFLNSGYAIGTVRAMRKLFDQARKNLEHEKNFGSDQFIFSHVYGDQEVWREAIRLDALSDSDKQVEALVDDKSAIKFNPDHIEAVRNKAATTADGTFEFGIGMDFRSEVGINTVFNEDETAWLTWSNKSQKLEEEQKLDIKPPRVSNLQQFPPDIAETLPPFWTFKHEKSLPSSTKWSDVPLFTDVYIGSVPAVIHHNAHRDGRKALREQWWDKTWFFKHLRALYSSSVHEPFVPLAYSGYNEEAQKAWWPSEERKGGARNGPKLDTAEETWLGFEQICADHHEEVFRDGKGPWVPL